MNKVVPGLVAAIALIAGPAQASRYPFDPQPKLEPDPARAVAGHYSIDIHHASVIVRLSHMGLSNYTLRFNTIGGGYDYIPADPTHSKIRIDIDPASIDTGDRKFDALIAKDYFEITQFPTITFVSNKIFGNAGRGRVEGILEMHGIRKPVVLDVIYHGSYNDERPERMGFSAVTTINRSDFGVDPYVPAESNAVKVVIEAEFRRD